MKNLIPSSHFFCFICNQMQQTAVFAKLTYHFSLSKSEIRRSTITGCIPIRVSYETVVV